MTTIRVFFVSALLAALSVPASGQEEILFPTQHHCAFSGRQWESELYSFPMNPRVQRWVDEILEAGEVTQNFELIQTNVENVAAVFDTLTGRRYLFFSQHFIENARTKLEVYASLAHEIAHHAYDHTLSERQRHGEELEADEFMGFVLQRISGVSFTSVESARQVIRLLPSSRPDLIKAEERLRAIGAGWDRSEAFVAISSASFETDPNHERFLRATFDFAPCCSPLEIERGYFYRDKSLGDVARHLQGALKSLGYYYHSYLSVPGGFALVTQMEQFQSGYTCRLDDKRWSTAPVGESFRGFVDYFKRLVQGEKALFRVFVFVVSDQTYQIEGKRVTKDEAAAWCGRAVRGLPGLVASQPFTEKVRVDALVYEFEVPESNRAPRQKCPYIDTYRHLYHSRILDALGR